jgi:hypothetical protein
MFWACRNPTEILGVEELVFPVLFAFKKRERLFYAPFLRYFHQYEDHEGDDDEGYQ